VYLLRGQDYFVIKGINSWIGVIVSVLMFVSLFYIRRIINLYDLLDEMRTIAEKRLLSAVIRGEENVRKSIAKDLHDGIAPLLSSLKMIVSSVDLSSVGEENRKSLERGDYVIEEAIVALKEISNQLSPHLLRNYGLNRAVSSFINQCAGCDSLSVNFEMVPRDRRYSVEVETSLYRIITELVNNTVKHSSATLISLKVSENENGDLVLDYHDDGKGCEIKAGGMGLENIRSRVKYLGGECFIDSKTGEGFKIMIVIKGLDK
jgi:signal transduction histidine kinase